MFRVEKEIKQNMISKYREYLYKMFLYILDLQWILWP